MKIVRFLAFIGFVLAFMTTSCEDESVDRGYIKIKMTDAPADFTAVNVNIVSVQVKYSGEGGNQEDWKVLGTKSGIYDLLTLRNDVTTILAADQVPAGKVEQMRLILGFDNSIVNGGDTLDLAIPGEYNTGVKINLNDTIKAGSTLNLKLDFNADKSVVSNGNGSFLLVPVVKIAESYYTTN